MRQYDAQVSALLSAERGLKVRHLVWIAGKNRSTGVTETTGVWSGSDVRSFTIGSASRSYVGAGALLGVEAVSSAMGLQVRRYNITLSSVAPEILQAVYGYERDL